MSPAQPRRLQHTQKVLLICKNETMRYRPLGKTGLLVSALSFGCMRLPEDMELFAGLGRAKHFYFAHSYHAQVADAQAKIAYTDYGSPLTASVQKANIYGVQFHPEKSGNQGLQVLKNFDEICRRKV